MTNPLQALAWRLKGSYDPQGPVTKKGPEQARNRARYEAWKYTTFGPGRDIYGKELTDQIIDSGQLSGEPLFINDPMSIAATAAAIAEMEGHRDIAFRGHTIIYSDREEGLELVARKEEDAIRRVTGYFEVPPSHIRQNLERLKEYHDHPYSK